MTLTIPPRSRLLAGLLLVAALGACSKQEEPAAGAAASTTAPAPKKEAAPAEPAVAAKVQGMGADELRDLATQALRENRMYAPAGDNAMEYYLALRDKMPDDATVASALTDLMPYTVIATEQAVTREHFDEARRLVALIEKADPKTPALGRIRQSITNGEQMASRRSEAETARAKAEAEAKIAAERQRAVQQQAAEAEAARRLAEQQEAARQAAAERERREAAEREAAARQAAAQQQAPRPAQQAPRPPALRPISMPAPRYPPDALRSGTSGDVLVEFTVGTSGEVTDARVVRANPPRIFDREAINAVRRWKFEPIDAPVTTRRTLAFAPTEG
ncbi:TonB family protein [Pseudoxanthomonas suwonensis 11-1]|uniref:Protein TonB n=2 Tax=Pseudoxanthomonas suwonensis TaxID=314722 RepID=E6WXG1_PSEUU|nr:energy transducer TonB [Pseudoxanthomonas suwonensis]ADV28930.1 TonB family protein [Pseudoxanthomonas suwonensis 11-1]